ncbi:shikimate dehydrogenase [Corynebacterium hadale]|uniref:Shikimate dehydrogenase (NADP(+)) n=1 Tax=Corynebacterium hadale TaxID=2026255 RepID=A0AB36RKW8_9CORY|nr:shikimate dehydrogenase [Corynebacterium hadale]PAT09791.1 shikimate dehydrogenase [Corynebacterium hadale]
MGANTTEILQGTYLFGLVGQGIGPSRTPAMHEAEGLAQGHATVYRRFDTLHGAARDLTLQEILRAAVAAGFNGLNITHPHKQEVIQYLDEVDERARAIGAVNTVVIRDGKLSGYNTDVTGFGRGLETGLPGADLSRIVQLGAGGAGNAVANSLITAGAQELLVADLDLKRAERLAQSANTATGSSAAKGISLAGIESVIAEATGVVNATPVGMAQHPGTPFDTNCLEGHQWVSDVIYMPLETQLLKDAKERGCATLDGSRMAVGQAVDAFELFTGLTADAARMRETFISLGS